MSGILTFVLLLCPQYMVYEKIVPPAKTIVWAASFGVVAALVIYFVVKRYGVTRLRAITLVPLAALLFFLLEMNGHLLDVNYSARPLAQEIQQAAPNVPTLAVQNVRRDIDYGLAFYRNEALVHYDKDGVPDEEHLLVLPTRDVPKLDELLHGRTYAPLFLYGWQGLSVYKVYAR